MWEEQWLCLFFFRSNNRHPVILDWFDLHSLDSVRELRLSFQTETNASSKAGMSDRHKTQRVMSLFSMAQVPLCTHSVSQRLKRHVQHVISYIQTRSTYISDWKHLLPPRRSQSQSTGSWWAEWSPCCCAPLGQIYSPPGSMVLCDKKSWLKTFYIFRHNTWIKYLWNQTEFQTRSVS